MVNDIVTKHVHEISTVFIDNGSIDKFTSKMNKAKETIIEGFGSKRNKKENIIDTETIKQRFKKVNDAYSAGVMKAKLVNMGAWEDAAIFDDFISKNHRFNKQFNKGYIDTMKKAKSETHKFKMELLGVMFFGMAMQRFFGGLLQPAAEVFGIFDLWNTLLMVFFLPVMEDLFNIFMWVFDLFIDAPNWIKKLTGWFVVLGLIIGGLLTVTGQWGTAWNSLARFFSLTLIPLLAKIGITSLFSFGVWALVIGAIALAVFLVIKYHKTLWEWIKNIGKIGAIIFMGLLNTVLWVVKFILSGLNLLFGWVPGLGSLLEKGITAFDGWNSAIESKMTELSENMKWSIKDSSDKTTDTLDDSGKDKEDTISNTFLNLNNITSDGLLDMSNSWTNFRTDELIKTENWNNKMSKLMNLKGGPKNITAKDQTAFGVDLGVWSKLSDKEKVKVAEGRQIQMKKANDFIWRAGQPPLAINSADNIVATKNGMPGGAGGNITIQQYNTFTNSKDDIAKQIKDANSRLVSDIQRLVGA